MADEHRHRAGLARREFLQVGFSGLIGLGASGWARRASAAGAVAANAGKAPATRSVVLIFLTGGPSHLETFDLKPDAPEGIRGEFKPIATSAPGIQYGEHLPKLARHADKLAIVRSMSHAHNNHLNATHWVLTGQAQPGAFFDKIASRDDYPHYASTLHHVRPLDDGRPSGVLLPTFLMEGPLVWPGQHAGFLGPVHDPMQIRDDPNGKSFKVEALNLPEGLSVERLQRRRELFDEVHRLRDALGSAAESAQPDPLVGQRQAAYDMLLSNRIAEAFQIDREPAESRDRYGRHMFGQSLVLARRLVEVGVPMIQVNFGRVQNWDSHGDIFNTLKDRLLPPADAAISAFLDDLSTSGLLSETLVVITGEFGRTPKLTVQPGQAKAGRDHWPQVFSAAFAGAGVRGGQYIGSSDAGGAYPASKTFTPADLAATVYRALGVPDDTELRDKLNRPIRVVTGRPIDELFTA